MLSREVLKSIRRIHLHARFLVRDAMMGEYKSSFKGHGMEFEEVREYSRGDDVRHIDWNVTARTQTPYVKKFREERELTVFLMMDMSASGSFGTRERFKRDVSAEIAAALAYLAIQNNDKVGVLLFADGVEKYIMPQKGRNHVLRVIREVLAFEPIGRGTNLKGALQFLMRVAKRRSVVFLLSDFQCDGYERMLQMVSRKHDVVAITPQDVMETNLPNVGLLALEDAESGEICVVDTASAHARQHFAALAREFDDVLGSRLRRAGVERIAVRTGESYLKPLVAFFDKRMRSRALRIGVILLVCLCLSALSFQKAIAQQLVPLKGTTADVYRYSFVVTHAPGVSVVPPDFQGAIADQDLRVVASAEEPPVNRDGKVVRTFHFDVAADLPGAYEIPKLTFKVGDGVQETSSIAFDVLSVTATPSAGQQEKPDILDIRPIREERWPYRYTVAVGAAALALVLAIVWGMFKLSGKKLFPKKELLSKSLSCHEKAMNALSALPVPACDNLDTEERVKVASQFHFQLGLIFKEYFEDRFLPNATDMTSEELWEEIRASAKLVDVVGNDVVMACKGFLQSADLVKFAKASATESALRDAKVFVKSVVQKVSDFDAAAQNALQKEPWRNGAGGERS